MGKGWVRGLLSNLSGEGSSPTGLYLAMLPAELVLLSSSI